MDSEGQQIGLIVDVIGAAISVAIVWLIIRQAVAAALRIQVVQQNDRILHELAEQTKALNVIAMAVTRGAPRQTDVDDLPPPPAARKTANP